MTLLRSNDMLTRVWALNLVIDGTPFECYGAHTDSYPCCYLTAACAIGATRKEMDAFVERLESAVQEYKNGAGRKDKKGKPTLGS
ncbi:unnamed protein product [Cladocopium goreaui]|uniref:Sep-tRNA:Sec-tRNA synthase n=1 Tax=Cladocopium goreaui TaxID=2562237 RepID=A0A9P1BUB1_9DINO|nr:unnamed protein product [Cladocopium goreaui]